MKKILQQLLLLLFLGGFSFLQSQENYYLPKNISYNPDIPTPEHVLGFQIGEWHVSHDKLSEYMQILAEKSDRISIENRGMTFEGRPLWLLTISSVENQLQLETIRKKHIEISEDTNNTLNLSNLPIVLYQGFSIHGNEPSGSNASLLYAYYLAAAEGDAIENILKNVVILLDPSFNPDGLQRFSTWVNANRNLLSNGDPNDREFNEIWPQGRTNHYWFDMNRDWLPVQLPESKARISSFTKWLPNILTDHHEMGTNSTFFFQPGVPSRTHPLTPKMNQILTEEIGVFHAEALNEIGSLYFTKERFDDFYYGKGSTYPDINGSIGILFEQASSRGHLQKSENGLLDFSFTVRNQFTTALSTLKAAENLRKKILSYQRNFYANAKKEAGNDKNKAIIFGDSKDPSKTYNFAKILKYHGIKFHTPKTSTVISAKKYIQKNSYIIPLKQKKYRLIKAIFEKRTSFTDSLFYDVSAWTLPLAFNIPYGYLKNTNLLGEEVKKLSKPQTKKIKNSSYAYLINPHDYYIPKVLYKLLSKKVRVKVGLKPFQLDGSSYDYGTYIIPVKNQNISKDSIYKLLQTISKNTPIDIQSTSNGLTLQGPDLGSPNFRTIKKPKVAVLVGDGIRSYDAGEIWHLMDTRYKIPITKIDIRYFSQVDLNKYTHFIIPSYSGKNLSIFKDKIKNWVKNGGILIGYRTTIKWLKKEGFINVEIKKKENDDVKNISFEKKNDYYGSQVIGGAIFQTKIDRSHPINFGIQGSRLSVFRNTTIFIEPHKNSFNNPIQYTNTPLLSGYISKENLGLLKNSVPLVIENLGKGKVFAITDNTNFRAFWYGTNRIFANILFHSNLM